MSKTSALTMKAPPRTSPPDWYKIVNKAADKTAEIYIYGEIGESWYGEGTSAKAFSDELKEVKADEITVHINSPGGRIFDGLAIYNTLKQHKAEITVVIDALAASAASFIACAADPGKLVMARNAIMMIHDGSGVAIGNAKDLRDAADVLDKLSDNIADIYTQRAGGNVEYWRAAMKEETWYTGTEAVTAGIADSVLETEDEDAEKPAAKFDVSAFNYAGREQAPSPAVVHSKIKSMMNKAQEAVVSGTSIPKAHGDGTGTPPAEGETPPVTEGEPVVAEPVVEEAEVGKDGDGKPVVGTQPAATPENKGAIGVLINGTMTYDPKKIQAHIEILETAQNEAKEASRKAFVKNLVDSNVLLAPQLEVTETFALGLSDDQYTAWTGTFASAQPNALFGRHGEGSTNHAGTGTDEQSEHDVEIEKLEAIVAYHKNGGRSMSEIRNMASYKKLQQLKPSSESKS